MPLSFVGFQRVRIFVCHSNGHAPLTGALTPTQLKWSKSPILTLTSEFTALCWGDLYQVKRAEWSIYARRSHSGVFIESGRVRFSGAVGLKQCPAATCLCIHSRVVEYLRIVHPNISQLQSMVSWCQHWGWRVTRCRFYLCWRQNYTIEFNRDFMQRRFTERRVSTNIEWCFVIGQCHGNNALSDVGVDAAFGETSLHKVPNVKRWRHFYAGEPRSHMEHVQCESECSILACCFPAAKCCGFAWTCSRTMKAMFAMQRQAKDASVFFLTPQQFRLFHVLHLRVSSNGTEKRACFTALCRACSSCRAKLFLSVLPKSIFRTFFKVQPNLLQPLSPVFQQSAGGGGVLRLSRKVSQFYFSRVSFFPNLCPRDLVPFAGEGITEPTRFLKFPSDFPIFFS